MSNLPADVKTTGELFDELSICNVKIFTLEDVKRFSKDDATVAHVARLIQQLNDRRSELKNAISERCGDPEWRNDIKVKAG
jgi:hypothetical protein